MSDKILHLMVGLPRSGKSTFARQQVYPIVEPDAIRIIMGTYPFQANMEPLVWAHAHIMVEALFEAGHDNVILDSTNHTHKRRKEWTSEDWMQKFYVIPPDVNLCSARAIDTGQERLLPVIKRMFEAWEDPHHSEDLIIHDSFHRSLFQR